MAKNDKESGRRHHRKNKMRNNKKKKNDAWETDIHRLNLG